MSTHHTANHTASNYKFQWQLILIVILLFYWVYLSAAAIDIHGVYFNLIGSSPSLNPPSPPPYKASSCLIPLRTGSSWIFHHVCPLLCLVLLHQRASPSSPSPSRPTPPTRHRPPCARVVPPLVDSPSPMSASLVDPSPIGGSLFPSHQVCPLVCRSK